MKSLISAQHESKGQIDQPFNKLCNTKEVQAKQNSSSKISSVISISNSPEETPRLLKTHNRIDQNTQYRIKGSQLLDNWKTIQISKDPIPNKSSQFLKPFLKHQLVQKFTKNLMMNSYIPSQKVLKNLNFENYVKEKQNSVEIEIEKAFIPLFQPDNVFVVIWDSLNIIITLMILWLTPFVTSYSRNIPTIGEAAYISITFYLVIDIFVNANKALLIQGQLINQRQSAIQHYILNYALGDIICCASWVFLFTSFDPYGIIRVLATITQYIFSYKKISRNFENHFESLYLKGNLSYVLDLTTLSIFIYYYAHLSGCIWHYISDQTSYLGKSWIIQYDLVNSDIWIRYNYAFYWATMTMTTVGYGDVSAQNQFEMIYSDIIMLSSTCIFAYSVNSIGIILKSLYDSNLKFRLSLIQINQYMVKHSVEHQLQSRIRNYLKYFIKKEQNDNINDINNIITTLPNSLKYELTQEISMKIIKQMKPIRNLFSIIAQSQLAQILEQVHYMPGDHIFKIGDKSDKFFYFIQEGNVELMEEQSQMKLRKLSKGDSFGYYQFFTGFPPSMTARCTDFTEVYRIDREQALEILQFNNKDYEAFHLMKDQILFNNNYAMLDQKCYFCSKVNHLEINCPVIQYKPDLEQRIKKSNYQIQLNERKWFSRKQLPRINCLGSLIKLSKSVENYNNQESQSLEQIQSLNTFEKKDEVWESSEAQSLQSSDIVQCRSSNSFTPINIVSKKKIENQKVQYELYRNQEQKRTQIQVLPAVESENNRQQDKIRSLIRNNEQNESHRQRSEQKKSYVAHHEDFHNRKNTIQLTKEFSMLEDLLQGSNQSDFQLDKVQYFIKYMPQNNIDNVIRQSIKFSRKTYNKFQFILKQMDKYTFFYQVKLKAFRLKSYFSRKASKYNLTFE